MALNKRTLITLGLSFAVLVPALAIATILFIAQPVRFQGPSMMPTYQDGDRLLLRKRSTVYERGDVVCFHDPRDPVKSLVKRIIGLPGEQIEIRNGEVYINGVALAEPYVSPEYSHVSSPIRPVVIPEGQYFVMGDNRDRSSDSRTWGPVPAKLIYGKVLFRYG